MRREKKEYSTAWKSFPLFWSECSCCNLEFRLEVVWKFCVNEFDLRRSTDHMVCKSCARSRVRAEIWARKFAIEKNDSTVPMPECKDPKPEEPSNIVIEDFGLVDAILPDKAWPRSGRKRDLKPPPPALKRKGICFYSGKKL